MFMSVAAADKSGVLAAAEAAAAAASGDKMLSPPGSTGLCMWQPD
jgi:hypothetical protein